MRVPRKILINRWEQDMIRNCSWRNREQINISAGYSPVMKIANCSSKLQLANILCRGNFMLLSQSQFHNYTILLLVKLVVAIVNKQRWFETYEVSFSDLWKVAGQSFVILGFSSCFSFVVARVLPMFQAEFPPSGHANAPLE